MAALLMLDCDMLQKAMLHSVPSMSWTDLL